MEEDSTCSFLEHVGNDGKQIYQTKFYNLDAILSVGYRVNSIHATDFRKWANSVLKKSNTFHDRFLIIDDVVYHNCVPTARRGVEGFSDPELHRLQRLARGYQYLVAMRPTLL